MAGTSGTTEAIFREIDRDLEKWRSPDELDQRTYKIFRRYGIGFWNRGKLKKAREALAACEYGRVLSASAVRMSDTIWPDFWLRVDDEEIPFELVGVHNPEAHIPRWLSDGEKSYNKGEPPAPLKMDLHVVEREIVGWIKREVEKKRQKAREGNYLPGTILAVHVQFAIPSHICNAIFRVVSREIGPNAIAFRAIVLRVGRQTFIANLQEGPYKKLDVQNAIVRDEFQTWHPTTG